MFFKIQWLKVSEEFPSPCIARILGKNDYQKIPNPETGKPMNSISGRVTKASVESFNYMDPRTKKEAVGISYKVFFEYKNNSHVLDIGTSRVGRTILNALAGATKEQLENISISVFRNKEWYNGASVSSKIGEDSEKVPWLLDSDEMKGLIEQTTDKNWTVLATDATLFNAKMTEIFEAKEFPERKVQKIEKNALDFLDGLDDNLEAIKPTTQATWETYEQALAKEESVKARKKTEVKDDDLVIDLDPKDFPF